MLRKIPDSAVPFVRDGVLPAQRLALAEHADRLVDHARRRAVDIGAAARDDAERQCDEARRVGYREGFEHALSNWLPRLGELLEDEAQLKSRTRQAMERYLDVALADAGVEAALITRCCERASDADNAPDTWTLYLPNDRGELMERLRENDAERLDIRRGDAPWPVLERGDVVIEIDPKRPASRHLAEWLDTETLRDALEQRARAYADDASRALRHGEVRRKIRHRDTGDAT